MQRKKTQKCPQIAGWMTTFTDMTTLLLTFFILMFTTAEVDGNELRLILSSFAGSFGVLEGGLTLQKGALAEAGMTVESLPSQQSGSNLAQSSRDFTSQVMLKLSKHMQNIKVKESERGIIISIPGRVFFYPDDANLKPEGKELLDDLVYLFLDMKTNAQIDTQVEIEGHASIEPSTLGFSGISTLWERNLDLSTDRAKNVEKFFIQRFREVGDVPPTIRKANGKHIAKFVAKGYGEFEPYEDADTPESRAWNRRVDIVINRN